MNKKTLLLSGLLTYSLYASDTLTQINFEQNDDGNFNPNIFVPLYWSENIYSGLGYISSTNKDIGTLDNFNDSKNGAVATTNNLKINWFTYKFGNFSAGLQSNFINIDKNEFGYIHDSNNIFGEGSDYYIAFDNDIELDVIKTGLYLDYQKHINNFLVRLSTNITPSTTIKVEQETLFKPLVSQTGSSSSSTTQDLAYGVKFEAYYDTKSFIRLGLEYSYDFMPLKYDLAQLAVQNNTYLFNDATIDNEEITTKYLAKLYFDKKMLGGLNPTIGFGSKKIKIKDKNTDATSSQDENLVTLGFEKRF